LLLKVNNEDVIVTYSVVAFLLFSVAMSGKCNQFDLKIAFLT